MSDSMMREEVGKVGKEGAKKPRRKMGELGSV
jgi:hypothetical protein